MMLTCYPPVMMRSHLIQPLSHVVHAVWAWVIWHLRKWLWSEYGAPVPQCALVHMSCSSDLALRKNSVEPFVAWCVGIHMMCIHMSRRLWYWILGGVVCTRLIGYEDIWSWCAYVDRILKQTIACCLAHWENRCVQRFYFVDVHMTFNSSHMLTCHGFDFAENWALTLTSTQKFSTTLCVE